MSWAGRSHPPPRVVPPARSRSNAIWRRPKRVAECCITIRYREGPFFPHIRGLADLAGCRLSQRHLIGLPAGAPTGMPAPDSGYHGVWVLVRVSSQGAGVAGVLFFGHGFQSLMLAIMLRGCSKIS